MSKTFFYVFVLMVMVYAEIQLLNNCKIAQSLACWFFTDVFDIAGFKQMNELWLFHL